MNKHNNSESAILVHSFFCLFAVVVFIYLFIFFFFFFFFFFLFFICFFSLLLFVVFIIIFFLFCFVFIIFYFIIICMYYLFSASKGSLWTQIRARLTHLCRVESSTCISLFRRVHSKFKGWLFYFSIIMFYEIHVLRTNRVDPDPLRFAASALDLHCLPVPLFGDARHKCVKLKENKLDKIFTRGHMTLNQRPLNVDATSWRHDVVSMFRRRCINVMCSLGYCLSLYHSKFGVVLNISSKPWVGNFDIYFVYRFAKRHLFLNFL